MTTEKKPLSHPPYLQMIGEAIGTLKERTGSSQYAITKFMEEKHKDHLPPNFKKLILVQLRKLTASGKLTKVKNSYKLPSSAPATAKPKPAAEAKPKSKPTVKAAAAKPKVKPATVAKPKAKPRGRPAKDAPAKKAAKPVVKPRVKKVAQSPAKVKKVAPVKPKSVKKTPMKRSAPVKKARK